VNMQPFTEDVTMQRCPTCGFTPDAGPHPVHYHYGTGVLVVSCARCQVKLGTYLPLDAV
jgi:hypothetical protein